MLKQMEWKAEVTGRKADVLQVTAPHPPPNTELDINGHRMSIQDMDTIRAERKRREEEKRLKKEHRAHEDAIAALLAALQGVKGTGGRGGGRGYTAKDVVVPVAHLHAVLKVIAQDRTKQTPPTPATPLPSVIVTGRNIGRDCTTNMQKTRRYRPPTDLDNNKNITVFFDERSQIGVKICLAQGERNQGEILVYKI